MSFKTIHLIFFVSGFLLLLLSEMIFPKRRFDYSRPQRVGSNLSLAFLNNIVIHFLSPFVPITVSLLVSLRGWGLFQRWDGSFWLEWVLGILVLDLIIYGQHIAFHKIPFLWRLHRVHHADLDLDVSTGIRFHTFEILISLLIKICFIVILGIPPLTVFAFELLLMLTSMFNHANIKIPFGIDQILRCLIITPDVHRVHHSLHRDETDSNYGFNFPWWDRIFRTYKAQPKEGHLDMKLGIELFRSEKWLWFHRLLIEPFIQKKD